MMTPIIITIIKTFRSTSLFIFILDCPCDFLIFCHHYGYYYFCYHCFYFIECPDISFQNSWYIFTKKGEGWNKNRKICQSQGGELVSIETEEEWNFINDEIQNRSTILSCSCDCNQFHLYDKWYIGLEKKGERWTWVNGKLVNMSNWAEEPKCEGAAAYIGKRSIKGNQRLFYEVHGSEKLAYICEIPRGKTKLLFIFNFESIKRHAESACY